MKITAAHDRLRIIVLGYLVRGPLGGLAWHHLQYIAGLMELGHDVFFFEDSDDFPSCYNPQTHCVEDDPTYGLHFVADAFERLGLPPNWCYFQASTNSWLGPAASKALDICRTADLLLNVSAVNPLRPWFHSVPRRTVIDTDPAFTQARALVEPAFKELLESHNVFLTFGENYGCQDCRIPCDSLPWRPTRQPVLLSAWKAAQGSPNGAFTTVMQWDSYKCIDVDGTHLGMKSESFGPFFDLPRRTRERMEIGLGSNSAPRDELKRAGWSIVDPVAITHDPWTYQAYIAQSKAEFSVAKHGYVQTNSGWFSERSAAYLASGRPVVVQETGFSARIPTGRGIIPFTCLEEAVAGIEEVSTNYERHRAAAREIVEHFFNSEHVLLQIIAESFSDAIRAPR